MKIEIEQTEDGGYIIRNSEGKFWIARDYHLLGRVREAFGIIEKKSKKLPKKEIKPSETFPVKKTKIGRK